MARDDVDVHFLRDGGQPMAEPADLLAGLLASAKHEVAIAIYDFHFKRDTPGEAVARTLQDLHRRGVRVRIVDHDEPAVRREVPVPPPAAPPEYVDSLGLDVVPATGVDALMHHKYAVVDGQRVWTGSLNWTGDAFTRQENCILVVRNEVIAQAYLRNFEEMRDRRRVEGTGDEQVPWQPVTIGGQPARARPMFCPGGGPEAAAAIAGAIRRARRRIAIASPVLTSGPILGALADACERGGPPVVGVVDGTQMADVLRQWARDAKGGWKAGAYQELAREVPLSGKRSTPWGPGRLHDYMHAKLVVADDVSFVGSYNHSRSGEENAENVMAVESVGLADRLVAFIAETATRYRGDGDGPPPRDHPQSPRTKRRPSRDR